MPPRSFCSLNISAVDDILFYLGWKDGKSSERTNFKVGVEKVGRKNEAAENIFLVWLHNLKASWHCREYDLEQEDLHQ